MAGKFVLKKGSSGKYHFNLVASNGQVIATSETYERKESALNGIESVRPAVYAEKLGQVAGEFDRVHSIERARQVGSVQAIVPAARLRPYLIDAVRRGMQRTLAAPGGR